MKIDEREVGSPKLHTFRVGSWVVYPDRRCFIDGEKEVRVSAKAMAVLAHLVAYADGVAAKDEIIRDVWAGKAVSDDALSVTVHELRKALGDNARAPRFIETISGQGYRWLHEVEPVTPDVRDFAADAAPPAIPAATSASLKTRPDRHPRAHPWHWLAATAIVSMIFVWPRSSSKPTPVTVAVLPLMDDSPEPIPNRGLADGMTGALIQSLARLMPLQVISRTSVSRFTPPTQTSAPEIAHVLGADLLLEGTIHRADQEIRLASRLIDSEKDRPIWASSYDTHLGNWNGLQWRIASSVAREVRAIAAATATSTSPT